MRQWQVYKTIAEFLKLLHIKKMKQMQWYVNGLDLVVNVN